MAADTRFASVLEELILMHDRKQDDYGKAHDPYANVRASDHWGIPGWIGALMRGSDKIVRLQKAAGQVIRGDKASLSNEGVRDSLVDLAVYVIIAVVLWDENHSGDHDLGPDVEPEDLWAANYPLIADGPVFSHFDHEVFDHGVFPSNVHPINYNNPQA